MRVFAMAALVVAGWAGGAWALDDGLARTPPMGWNSWNRFRCRIDEGTVRGIADAMVASGMREAGYQYVVIDDCWLGDGRSAAGELQATGARFAGGIKALADYVHERGLKLGLYASIGRKTCAGKAGSLGSEMVDTATFAAWGVDYIKADRCHVENVPDLPAAYARWRDGVKASGRPMVISASDNQGVQSPWLWGAGVSHLWRISSDIHDEFTNAMSMVDRDEPLAAYAGPGAWNDPDMLEVGNGGMTDDEYRAHFGMWAMLAAPLIAGNDLRAMSPAIRDILLNPEVIAVDQDPRGRQARKVWDGGGGLSLWSRELEQPGARAVALLNRSEAAATIAAEWGQLGLPPGPASVRDLWARQDRGVADGRYAALVPPHAVVLLRVSAGGKASDASMPPAPDAAPISADAALAADAAPEVAPVAPLRPARGGGCQVGPGQGTAALVILLLVAIRTRRRR